MGDRLKPRKSAEEALLEELREVVLRLSGVGPVDDDRVNKRLRSVFETTAANLHSLAQKLDRVVRPASVFDPSNPGIVGRMIALTLIAQSRTLLTDIGPFYGSGVYAIYYTGKFPVYAPIARTEHPIYVGKADPAHDQAKDPMTQGTKLFARLGEHAKSIRSANNLNIGDFQCRFLIVTSGWQKAAEEYLIRLFKPIWNSEVKICFGIGKHGDSADTRANLRSPWDTMHPGRKWAIRTTKDQKSELQIRREVAAHFARNPPYQTEKDLFDRFMTDMRQLPSS